MKRITLGYDWIMLLILFSYDDGQRYKSFRLTAEMN